MNINIRRINLIILIIVFFILTSFVLLYSMGWRYDFKGHTLIKTGVLTLESNPKNADIYINNKLIDKKTPAIINNLTPGQYNLELKKDNYFSWHKDITIYPSLATIYNNTYLLRKNNGPEKLLDDSVIDINVSPSAEEALLLINDSVFKKIILLNLNNFESKLLYQQTKDYELSIVQWSYNSQKMLVKQEKQGQDDEYLVLSKTNQPYTTLKDVLKPKLNNLKWDINNDNIIYGFYKNALYKLNLSDLSVIKVVSLSEPLDYFVDQNIVYVANQKELYYLDLRNPGSTVEVTNFTKDADPIFLDYKANQLLVLDQNNATLHLYNNKTNLLKKIEATKAASFNNTADQLLYYNDFELWVYDIKNDQQNLLTRVSNKIGEARWHPNNAYIIYSQESSLKARETDLYEPNTYDLINLNVKLFIVTKKGESIIFSSPDNLLEKINI